MRSTKYMEEHEAFVFELDDVLYPVKDFHLQVYYLFASFLEYTEQLDASAIVLFMKETYEQHGERAVLDKTFAAFGIADKYRENFALLNKTAKLPLKLLMFNSSIRSDKSNGMAWNSTFGSSSRRRLRAIRTTTV